MPASALAASRLFVLPVATRRWILTDNNRMVFPTGTNEFMAFLASFPVSLASFTSSFQRIVHKILNPSIQNTPINHML